MQNHSARVRSFTVGKLDGGMAILLSPDHHMIEFPATILPSGVSTGSIVNISISRDTEKEKRQREDFLALQDEIYKEFNHAPEAPVIFQKAATQTSVTVAWEPLKLYNCELRSIEVYKKGQRTTPHFFGQTAAKLTGLDVNSEYEVHVVVKTSGGNLVSNHVVCKTHSMDNLTGIQVAFGEFQDAGTDLPPLKEALERIGASWTEDLSPENTHLVCTLPRGDAYQRAMVMNIPVVTPEWLKQCEAQKKVQPVGAYAVLSGSQENLPK
ncbi:hypothetical protein DFJ74DRAFT_600630 [Hyaloraphidium curvatum]|nr:hypothetical protein DFJ74DRAFT_600630 [Hyaloraphidium curvatum]